MIVIYVIQFEIHIHLDFLINKVCQNDPTWVFLANLSSSPLEVNLPDCASWNQILKISLKNQLINCSSVMLKEKLV